MSDENRRDYNVSELKELDDKRLRGAAREMKVAQIFTFAYCVITFAIVLLAPQDNADITYIAGFPTWYALCVLVAILSMVFVWIFCKKGIKTVSLAARADDTEVEE